MTDSALGELFELRGRVGRARYLQIGIGCAIAKYAVDLALHFTFTGQAWAPWRYLSPYFSYRYEFVSAADPNHKVLFALISLAWGLPFLWIGFAMSARRARDAGLSPWTALWLFVPGANLLMILWLSARRTRVRGEAAGSGVAELGAVEVGESGDAEKFSAGIHPVVILAATAVVGLIYLMVSTEILRDYGFGLFFTLPALIGVATGAAVRSASPDGRIRRTYVSALCTAILLGGLLLMGVEGLVCLVMAFPLVFLAVWFGVAIGAAVVRSDGPPPVRTMGLFLVALPVTGGVGELLIEPPLHEVCSTVEIDVPPERVWEHVVSFSELPKPDTWLFDTGVAYPVRARIEGEGVGAVRYCEFSTGPFVEPITTWEEPHRLAFDVRSQPAPMEEWSFYAHVHPPHLESAFRSVRGEFRLVPLPGGRTRLEGRTWYRLDMGPVAYWKLWSDLIIHRIHHRVLSHVQRLSEGR